MGILDDAIREHLDLKRKHGAREGELQQLEDEAFGPPTRPDEPDFPDRPPTGEEAVVAEAATEEGATQPAVEELEPFAEAPADSPPPEGAFFDQELAGPPPPAEVEVEPPPPPPEVEVEPPPPPERDAPPEPVPEPESAPEPEAIAGEPTVEHPAPAPPAPGAEEGTAFEVDEEFEEFRETEGEEDEEEEEDVLEETPEFLRDTPENERLWFEQGEPQDFDFDDADGEGEGEDRPAS